MDNNKICNTKVEVPTGMFLNDKDYITCFLSGLKDMEKNYVIAMTEASNEKLYELYKNTFIQIASLQREVYELMFRKGWYCLGASPVQKITQKFNMMSQEYQDMMK